MNTPKLTERERAVALEAIERYRLMDEVADRWRIVDDIRVENMPALSRDDLPRCATCECWDKDGDYSPDPEIDEDWRLCSLHSYLEPATFGCIHHSDYDTPATTEPRE